MKRVAVRVIILVAAVLIASSISAIPTLQHESFLELVSYQQFMEALKAGRITPVTEWDQAFTAHYPGLERQLREPRLKVMDGIEGAPEPGLLMVWGKPEDRGLPVLAAWQYEGSTDLRSTIIKLSVLPPSRPRITSVDFALVDENGCMKSWVWDVGCCGLQPDVQHTFYINPELGGYQAGASSYYEDGCFDITRIKFYRFSENGIWVDEIAPDGDEGAWNYWKNIRVIPIP